MAAATTSAHCQSLRFLCLRDGRSPQTNVESKKPRTEIIHNSTASESRRGQFFNWLSRSLRVHSLLNSRAAVFHERRSLVSLATHTDVALALDDG